MQNHPISSKARQYLLENLTNLYRFSTLMKRVLK